MGAGRGERKRLCLRRGHKMQCAADVSLGCTLENGMILQTNAPIYSIKKKDILKYKTQI